MAPLDGPPARIELSLDEALDLLADLEDARDALSDSRRLGVPTRALVRLISERQIRYVMVEGIAHVPEDALDEYEAKAS